MNKKRSKRFRKLKEVTLGVKSNSVNEILPIIKNNSNAKFDESLDLNFQINLKSTKSNFGLRTVVNLPNGTGKKVRVAVICEDAKIEEAKKFGADLFGSNELIKKIENGELNFDKLISTPLMMAKIAKLGKVLGPKGLMPNPKLGTVTNDIATGVKLLKKGQVEIKNDKDGNIGISIGKKSFTVDKLTENFNAIIDVIKKEKPTSTKGNFFFSAFISSTMGVSHKLKIKGIN